MAAEDIHVRLCLQEIVRLDLEVKALIQDIRECADTKEVLEDINVEARGKVNKLRKKIEELETLGFEQDKEEDRQIIHKDVENQKQRLASTVSSLRKTNVSVQLRIDKCEKDMLLKGGTSVRKRTANSKEILAKRGSDISESLMSLNRTMAAQVERSELTKSTLIQSSSTLHGTQEEMKSMGGHLVSSRKLITKYGRRQLTDRLLIFLAVVFFFATVLYIVKKRIW
ncbi:vesicle transport protein SEC20-like [Pecten maximus]|uniref:vesicle transport protein SEC20-like n=1 Tax=Pecten maximus TaxID=6579 RepID=UPI001457EE38|nr:vesicle transport protein SEC20-like [Pecten maximus]